MTTSSGVGAGTKARAAGKAARGGARAGKAETKMTGKAVKGGAKAGKIGGQAEKAMRDAKATPRAARGGAKAVSAAAKGGAKAGARAERVRMAGKAAPMAAKGGAKAARATGRHTARGAKAQAKLARAALRSSEPKSSRYLKYALFAIGGLALGSLLARGGGQSSETSSSFTGGTGVHTPESGSPAAERGQTWGSGSSLGAAGGASEAANYQTPGEANTIGADREFSDPAAGPLIGGRGHPEMDMTERNQITEQRIRTGIGEVVDTEGLPKINVEVNDGIVELRGPVPSADVKETIEEVAADTDGVREVRSNLTVDNV